MLTKTKVIIVKLFENFVIYFGALDGSICNVYSFPKLTVLIEEYFLSHGGCARCIILPVKFRNCLQINHSRPLKYSIIRRNPEVRQSRCVGSITKNFMYYTYS